MEHITNLDEILNTVKRNLRIHEDQKMRFLSD